MPHKHLYENVYSVQSPCLGRYDLLFMNRKSPNGYALFIRPDSRDIRVAPGARTYTFITGVQQYMAGGVDAIYLL